MQEAEEQDTCRICSAPAEPDQPLFHPCKCSGTIRYIHQDCLTTWLAHSKKKNCDVCKHPYSFTKVYAPDMPSTLPTVLLLRRLAQQVFLALLFVLRAIAVATIWLGVLPWVTVWTWRMYFSMGESTAWWLTDRPRPATEEPNPFYSKIRHQPSTSASKNFLAWLTSHPVWVALPSDIFTGQIIAALIVLTFIAVFLLREWISQNARPGVFEEEPLPDDLPPPAPVQAPQLAPVRQPPAPIEPHQPPPPPPPPPPIHEEPAPIDFAELGQGPEEREEDWVDEEPEGHVEEQERVKRKKRAAPHAQDILRRHANRTGVPPARRRIHSDPLPESSNNPNRAENVGFEFTFTAPRQLPVRPSPLPDVAEAPWTRAPGTFKLVEHQPLQTPGAGPSSGPLFEDSRETPFVFGSEESALQPAPPAQMDDNGFRFNFDSSSSDVENMASLRDRYFPLPPGEQEQDATHEEEEEEEDEYDEFGFKRHVEATEDEERARVQSVEIKYERHSPSMDYDQMQDLGDHSFPVTPPLPSTEDHPRPHIAQRETVPVDVPVDVETDTDSDVSDRPEGHGANDYHEGVPIDRIVVEDVDWNEDQEDEEGRVFDDDGEGMGEGGDVPVLDNFFEEDEDDAEWEAAVEEDEEDIGMEEQERLQAMFEEEGDVVEDNVAVNGRAENLGAAAAAAAAGIDINDDADGDVQDDMEGAMEAIGMRGPIFGILQNAALMIFVLDTAIGIGVWLPFTMGKTWALLTLDPPRMLKILHLPIRAMRIVTDPFVDTFTWLFVDVLLPWVFAVVKSVYQVFSYVALRYFGSAFGASKAEAVSEWPTRLLNQSTQGLEDLFSRFWPLAGTVMHDTSTEVSGNATSVLLDSLPDYLGFTEPYFATLGGEVRTVAVAAQQTWIDLALGSGVKERMFAVVLGYLAIGLGVMFYFHVLATSGTGVGLRNTIRQQFLVVKVAAFIFIELVIFPLGCGIVLDLCTIWLFPEANLLSRRAFFIQAPLTAMFYHWIAGTMFMYAFAVLLSGCRKVMRPGAMWFIKDPQDPNAHPIRDILDRPTFTQLRKIFISGIMYSFVVVCVVGSVAGLLVMGRSSIMPFRWKNREPLSSVPIDLILLHLVLPYTMRYFQPKPFIKQVATTVWKFLATRLRLTSYFFGTRNPAEEHTPRKYWFRNWTRPDEIPEDEEVIPDGTFRRVPATDNLALPRDMRATVPVTSEGEPVDDAAKELMALQNAEAEKAKRDVKEDYRVVYIPPHFRWRMIAFVTLLWMFGAVGLGFCVAVPIQFGRLFFNTFMSREVHDGYSFLVGFYLLWMCYLVGKAVDLLDKRRQRRGSGNGPRAHLYVLVLKRGFLWLAKTSYMVFFLGIVIPILLATVMDLFLVFPIRFAIEPAWKPRIRVVDSWALGLLYAKIATRTERLQPPNSITRGWRHIKQHGWIRPDPVSATTEVIAPLTGGLLAMILFPAVIFLAFKQLFPSLLQDDRFLFMHVYPVMFIMAGAFRTSYTFLDLMSTWSQTIRDKEFLVEMRLKNHDPEKDKEQPAPDPGVRRAARIWPRRRP